MSYIAVQSYLITEIVHTPPSAQYLEDDFEICCGIVFTIVKFVAAGIPYQNKN